MLKPFAAGVTRHCGAEYTCRRSFKELYAGTAGWTNQVRQRALDPLPPSDIILGDDYTVDSTVQASSKKFCQKAQLPLVQLSLAGHSQWLPG
jgi:hypothetical protein